MLERCDLLQDLDQVPRSQLAGSAAGGNERRQSDLVHDASIRNGSVNPIKRRRIERETLARQKRELEMSAMAVRAKRKVSLGSTAEMVRTTLTAYTEQFAEDRADRILSTALRPISGPVESRGDEGRAFSVDTLLATDGRPYRVSSAPRQRMNQGGI